MERFKIDINKSKLSIVGLALALGLTGCNSNKVRNDLAVKEDTSASKSTEVSTEYSTEIVTSEELNINDNASIEKVLDENYSDYMDFYNEVGMSKDDLRDVIFIINDKYQDEDGNLLVDEERVHNAYSNLNQMLVNTSVLQSMDNINTIEMDEEIGKQIDNSWDIKTHPTIVPLIDKNISGGIATAEKIKEFEDLRNHVIEEMNTNNKIDKETINSFVKKMEIDDYNTNSDNLGKVRKNGQKYLLADSKLRVLYLAAIANPKTIYLEGYEGIDKNIKINPTNEERFLENDILTLVQEGMLNGQAVDAILEDSEKGSLAYTPEEQEIINNYGLSNDQLRLVLSYAHYLTTMAYYKYDKMTCSAEAKTINTIESIKEYSNSMSKQYKKEQ